MASTPTYPGVYIREIPSPVHTIAGVATSIAAFVGYTDAGIDNRAEHIFSFSDFERMFGGLASDSELSYAVQQFFENGGTEAYVVRAPRAGATAANVVFGGLTFTALSSGAGANGKLLVDVDYTGIDHGADPKSFNLTITQLDDDDNVDTVESFPKVTVDSALSNYVASIVNDADNGSQLVKVQVAGTPGSAPDISGLVGKSQSLSSYLFGLGGVALTGTVDIKNANPAVAGTGTTFTASVKPGQLVVFASDATQTPYQVQGVTNDTSLTLATNYGGADKTGDTATVLTAQATKDFALQLTVSKPSPAPQPLPFDVKLFSKGGAVPQTAAGLAAQIQTGFSSVMAVQWAGASVQCSVSTGSSGPALRINAFLPENPDAMLSFAAPASASYTDVRTILGWDAPTVNVAHYSVGTNHGGAGWGSQTSSAAGSDGSGLPGTAELIGDQALFTGIYALLKVDLFNLLSIPDATRAAAGDSSALDSAVDPNSIYSEAISLCRNRRAFLLIDPPPGVNAVSSGVDWKTSGLTVHDPNGAAFFPRLRLPDALNKYQLRTFAPSGVVAGLYARIDSTRGVWKAPAGTEATLTGVQSLVYKLSDLENGALNPLGLNCFRTFPIYGSVLWGARTLVGSDAEANEWKYVPVRRVALFLEESLYRGTQWVVFEPNDEPLWAQIRLNVGAFMNDLFRKGAFQGATPTDAYFVKCDKETTTQNDIDQGVVNILVGFAPLKPAEFVIIQIQQMAGQVQS